LHADELYPWSKAFCQSQRSHYWDNIRMGPVTAFFTLVTTNERQNTAIQVRLSLQDASADCEQVRRPSTLARRLLGLCFNFWLSPGHFQQNKSGRFPSTDIQRPGKPSKSAKYLSTWRSLSEDFRDIDSFVHEQDRHPLSTAALSPSHNSTISPPIKTRLIQTIHKYKEVKEDVKKGRACRLL
jgi:hypothetical protein